MSLSEHTCISCRNIYHTKGNSFCKETTLPTEFNACCDLYKPNTYKKPDKGDLSKSVGLFFCIVMGVVFIVGIIYSIVYIEKRDYDASAANYLAWSAGVMIPWLAIKHVTIKHFSYAIIAIASIVFYMILLFYDGFDDIVIISIASMSTIIYAIFYIKLFTKYGQDLST